MKYNQHRTLHLVDIENLLGAASPTPTQAASLRGLYESMYVRGGDLVVLACSHHAFEAIAWEWPRARRIPRSGKDGADLALLDVIAGERVAERFRHVVVASGDAIFTDAVIRLGTSGVSVTVVARPESLSLALRRAAEQHVSLLGPSAGSVEPLESA